MTDDEKAHAVMEMLTGTRMCPVCGQPMKSLQLRTDYRMVDGKFAQAWFCENDEEAVYMLDDGTRIVPNMALAGRLFTLNHD